MEAHVTATLDPHDADTTQRLEQRALERMLAAMCRQIDLACPKVVDADRASREAALQHAAYLERRQQALSTAQSVGNEPHHIRVARLERLVNALQCSRAYFCGEHRH
jgi:hypothetical protein